MSIIIIKNCPSCLSCLLSLGGEEGEEGEAVAVEAEAGDDALADRGQQGFVAEGFATVDVADVDFDHGGGNGGNGIGNGDRRVGVAAGIQDNAAIVKAHGLQAVYNLTLDVALIDIDIMLRELRCQFMQVLVKRAVAIHLGLTQAHEVQVRAVDDMDGHFLK